MMSAEVARGLMQLRVAAAVDMLPELILLQKDDLCDHLV